MGWIVASAIHLSLHIPLPALGCPYSIRDVGFVDLNSIPYRLYFFVEKDTPQQDVLVSTFDEAARVILTDTNVEAEIVNLDKEEDHPALEYLGFWEVKDFPSAILVSPRGRSMLLPVLDPDKPLKESIWSALEGVVSSPKREEAMGQIVTAWCVVLLVEGEDKIENAKAGKILSAAIDDISRIMNRAGMTVQEAPHSIVFSPDSLAGEEILLWSLGLEQHESRGPRVATLFGRGRQFGPVLEADDLTQQHLLQLLSMVGMNCGCDNDLSWLSGTVIPRKWGPEIRAKVVEVLGFDPDNPMVKMEVSQLWSGAPASATDVGGPFAYSEGDIVNWEEFTKLHSQTPGMLTPGASGQPVRSDGTLASVSGETSPLAQRLRRLTFVFVFAMVVFALGGSAFILSRAKRKRSSL
jgi:hypothetical protein